MKTRGPDRLAANTLIYKDSFCSNSLPDRIIIIRPETLNHSVTAFRNHNIRTAPAIITREQYNFSMRLFRNNTILYAYLGRSYLIMFYQIRHSRTNYTCFKLHRCLLLNNLPVLPVQVLLQALLSRLSEFLQEST